MSNISKHISGHGGLILMTAAIAAAIWAILSFVGPSSESLLRTEQVSPGAMGDAYTGMTGGRPIEVEVSYPEPQPLLGPASQLKQAIEEGQGSMSVASLQTAYCGLRASAVQNARDGEDLLTEGRHLYQEMPAVITAGSDAPSFDDAVGSKCPY